MAALENGHVETFEVTPEEAGIERATLEDLKGGNPAFNAKAIHNLLDGAASAYRDAVVYNAAGALIVADKVKTLKEGAKTAAQAIDSGKAKATLEKLVAITNENG